jgi:quinol monooxygenase YgiN
MPRICEEQDVLTLINVFDVKPANQQALVDLLVSATEKTMSTQPGYVSANIHKSLDGTTVTNYAQWRSREDFEAIFQNPDARAHMEEAAKLAESFAPQLYEVAFCDGES